MNDILDLKTSFGLILNDLFTCWKFGFIFNPRLKWPPISCTWSYPLCILVFYGELIKPSSLNQISPTPLNKPPALLSSPSNVFEIDNHPRGGGGRVKRGFTVYGGNYAIGMFARNKKVHSARIITKSTYYYFLIEPMTGWLLRPIIRLVIFILGTCTIE